MCIVREMEDAFIEIIDNFTYLVWFALEVLVAQKQ